MQIHVHANHTVHTQASLVQWVQGELQQALARFGDDIGSVDAHLADINGERRSEDHKRCTLKARLRGRSPVAVHHEAEHLAEAVQGACDKLRRALDHETGRVQDLRQGRTSIRRHAGPS